MKEPKVTFVNLEQAYEDKKLRLTDPTRYKRLQRYEERIARGFCINCGHKKLTEYQIKNQILSCFKCRKKKKKYNDKRKNEL